MTKMTAKFKAAQRAAKEEGLTAIALLGAEALYQELSKRQYFWNAAEGKWIVAPTEDADPASKVIRVRVWSDKEVVEDFATDIANMLEVAGFDLQEKSPVYPCRPPKQNDGRVYLTFALPEKKHGQR